MKSLLQALRPPRTLRVTFPGKWFLSLTVGVGVAAINTGNNLLYLALSMNLSLIILSGILSEYCLRRVAVRIRPVSEMFASRESALAVTASAEGKRFPVFSLSIAPRFPGAGKPAWFSEVPAGGTDTRIIMVRHPRRGAVPSFSCAVSTRFPFGLFEKTAEVLPSVTPLVVYPEPAGPGDGPAGGNAGGDGTAAVTRGREGTSILGAREHMPTDPVRDIHWKASARMAKWMVKEREAEPSRTVELRLPASSPPEDFERLVSRACAQVLRCEREGIPYRLRIGERTFVHPSDPDRRRRVLGILATADAAGGIPSDRTGDPA